MQRTSPMFRQPLYLKRMLQSHAIDYCLKSFLSRFLDDVLGSCATIDDVSRFPSVPNCIMSPCTGFLDESAVSCRG